ncbi:MAG: response regulator [Lachnospiraceae bacterium]|nr:response regulator [Lachnospiraceae bacterium]
MTEESNISSKSVPRILVVDDVEANRFLLRNIIQEMGYQPILTESGAQALKMIQRMKPQLIILDIAMPDMDGYEVCSILKADPETKEIPIIFISAFDDPKDIVKGFELGGEDYITKPFVEAVVKARVSMHLKLNDSNRRMMELNRQLQVSFSEQLKRAEMERKSILYALIRIARENAFYDEIHMERLSYNCRILTEAMQLSDLYSHLISDNYIDTMELAVPLCDLGNLAIPTNILQKQGALNEEESAVMRTHTTIGARILQDIGNVIQDNRMIKIAEEIARSHHENWDGSGYPEGRAGEEIPLSAQIVAVVSTYCALTERRTYRDSYTREEAFEIMEKDAAAKFNPNIFSIMKKIVRQLH